MALYKYMKTSVKHVEYGTAGFRARAETLDYVVYRMGMLAVLRSQKKNSLAIGLMVTASHNPECDNGVKLIDPFGEMLDQSWELHATKLANADDEHLAATLDDIVQSEEINTSITGTVFIGRDTRKSSPALSEAACLGVSFRNGKIVDFEVVTTPMLHYFVTCRNTDGAYGEASEEGYYHKLSSAFNQLRGQNPENGEYKPRLLFDGAHGVGSIKMMELMKYLDEKLVINVYNRGDGILNHNCGADFVKVNQKPPEGLPLKQYDRCASCDGDADRLVYYYIDSENQFHLLDGDRIATLIATYLKELVQLAGLGINLGLVQTAYANGSSTHYISDILNVPVACVSTGVKYLHHKALDFDIGVYFEANGHGTVVFKKEIQDLVSSRAQEVGLDKDQHKAVKRLLDFMRLTNQTVGDALSDLLLVETVLHARGWSVLEWTNTYTDLPNRLSKVNVKDRNVIQTTDAERTCTRPDSLQPRIDEIVKQYPKGRSFVRPSGTEDVVRVYAEAETQEAADKLARDVSLAVYELANGVGPIP